MSADPQEVRRIRNAVAQGTLPQAYLDVAAVLGDAAAREATGSTAAVWHRDVRDGTAVHFDALRAIISKWPREACVRAAVAASRALGRVVAHASWPPLEPLCETSLRAAEDWCLTPGVAAAQECREAAYAARAGQRPPAPEAAADPVPLRTLSLTAVDAAVAAYTDEDRCRNYAFYAVSEAAALSWDPETPPAVVDALFAHADQRSAIEESEVSVLAFAVLDAVAQEVIPWATGRGDPVRDRVAARSTAPPP